MTYEEILEQPRKSINAEELEAGLKDFETVFETINQMAKDVNRTKYLLGKLLQYQNEERQKQ